MQPTRLLQLHCYLIKGSKSIGIRIGSVRSSAHGAMCHACLMVDENGDARKKVWVLQHRKSMRIGFELRELQLQGMRRVCSGVCVRRGVAG